LIESFDDEEDMFIFCDKPEDFNEDKIYEICHTDSDTILFRAATTCQNDYIIATHKKSGTPIRFKGVRQFYGNSDVKKNGGWLKEQNEKREGTGKEPLAFEDFSIEKCTELAGDEEVVLKAAMNAIDFNIGRLKLACKAKDYLLYIGGEGNFRYDQAHIVPYKGGRGDKPIMFKKLRDMFIEKYRSRIVIVDGMEADDMLGIIARKNYEEYLKTGKWKDVLSYVDKDLKMCISPYFNYDKIELGIKTPTHEEAMKYFFKQLLTGDNTDNIIGLPKATKEVKERFKLRASGVGPKSAEAIIDSFTIKEALENVVYCYQQYYGLEEHDFVSWRGESFRRTWIDYLRENAILLWMRIEHDEIFEISDMLDEYEVEYE
jgi:hypothetical protein